MSSLNAEKALIFRIMHIANVPWTLDNGLHCRNSPVRDPNYRNIGNPELIQRRHHRIVPIAPGGTLSDYVPFYFTPYSIMLFNIKTGYGGITQVPNGEIVILVSSLRRVNEMGIDFVFTNQHAYPQAAEFFNALDDLVHIDWPLLQARDFRHDPEDPGKKERYQAEALVHGNLPVEALHGIVCHNATAASSLQEQIAARQIDMDIRVQPKWYF